MSLITVSRIVARQSQNVVKALARQVPAPALEPVSIPIFAGQVNDDFLASRDEICAKDIRTKHRVAARIVGNAECMDAGVMRQLSCQFQHSPTTALGNESSRRHEFDTRDKRWSF